MNASRSPIRRLDGPDESFMIVERYAGLETPIQLGWHLPVDPGEDEIVRIHRGLLGSSIDRAVVRARVPFARDRWVPAAEGSTPRLETVAVADDEFSAWFTAHLDGTSVRPTQGRAWHLASAPTRSGGRLLSVLASHMVCDGNGLRREMIRAQARPDHGAVSGDEPGPSETKVTPGPRARRRDDLADAVGQLTAAVVAVARLVVALTSLLRGRGQRSAPHVVDLGPAPQPGIDPTTRRSGPTAPDPPDDHRPVRHLLCDVDRAVWTARATERGGTGNGLFCALFGGIAQDAGLVDGDETAVCIAVNRRGADDDRANASGGVWLRLRGRVGPHIDLAGVRREVKRALVEYSERGESMSADNIQPVVRLLPGRWVLKLMTAIPSPHTTVSNLGAIPDELLEIGGVRADLQFTRAAVRGMDAQQRRQFVRPALLGWSNEYDDTVTLAVCGVDPDRFPTDEALRAAVCGQLDAWDLPHVVR